LDFWISTSIIVLAGPLGKTRVPGLRVLRFEKKKGLDEPLPRHDRRPVSSD
jgi:hypothetical protein